MEAQRRNFLWRGRNLFSEQEQRQPLQAAYREESLFIDEEEVFSDRALFIIKCMAGAIYGRD